MFTKETIYEGSYKSRLEEDVQAFKDAGESYPEGRRKPETVISDVMSLADVNRIIAEQDKGLMMTDCGVVALSDKKVVFLTDDSYLKFGLPAGFMGLQWYLPNWTHGGRKHIRTAEDFLGLFYKGERVIQSMDELLVYLNENYRSPFA